jgi:type I restriction enzyme R subunit
VRPRARRTRPLLRSGNRYRSGSRIKDQNAADRLLTPFNHEVRQGERYYQQIAINRTVEAILHGQRRLLLTMATGTGKNGCCISNLLEALERSLEPHRGPPADRESSISPTATSSSTSPRDGIFAAFGDARCKIESGGVVKSREMYFAIYQALAETNDAKRRI